MMKRIKKLFLLILLIPIVLPISANAEQLTYGQVLDDLATAERNLQNNKNSINGAKGQIKEDSATINNLKKEIEDMKVETEKLIKEIDDSNAEIESKKQQTKSVISYLQMSQGENIYLEYIFGGETITDIVYRMAVVEQITEHNDQVVHELEELIKKNNARKVELADKQKKSEEKIVALNNEIAKLNSKVSSLDGLSPGLEQEVKAKKDLVDYYKSQGCKSRNQVIGKDCAVGAGNGIFYRPIRKGYITSFIGYRWGSLHRGLDIGSPDGRNTPLYSVGYGRITSIWTDYYGAKCVNVEYKMGNTYYTAIYAHMSRYGNIWTNMNVTPDTVLGYMGDTGHAYGVHLHLELWPCRLYADNNCRSWDSYTSYVKRLYDAGKSRGAESYISFPKSTYQYWYTK